MAKLTLRCGRFIPPAAGDTEGRLRSLERYLARLTEELEHELGTGEPSPDTVTAAGGDGEGDSHE